MTAIEFSRYELMCDGPEGHGSHRVAVFRPRISDGVRVIPRARVRVLAAKAGWTHVRSDLGREHGKDYCPAHKAAAEEAIAQRERRDALRGGS